MKNLKMFAIALLSMLVMVSGVHAAEENPCADINAKTKVYVSIDGEAGTCHADFSDVIPKNADDYKNVTIKLYGTVGASELTIAPGKNVTLDLNGYNVTATATTFKVGANGSLTVKSEKSAKISSSTNNIFLVDGGKLTVDGNVTLESTATKVDASAKKAMIAVKGNEESDKTEVNIGKNVTVTSKAGAGLIIYSDNSTDGEPKTGESTGVVANLAGTWKTKLYTVSVHGQVEEGSNNPVINVSEGKFTSSDTVAFYASGYGEWNIDGGEITGKDAFKYRTGKVVIEGDAKLTGTGKVAEKPDGTSRGTTAGAAFNFSEDDRDPIDKEASTNVKLNGGTFKSENDYAIYFESLVHVKDGDKVIEINGGTYSSKGSRAAIGFAPSSEKIGDADAEAFLENHEGFVKGGEFANGIATVLGSYPTSTIAETLTKGTEFKTDENGNIVVGNGAKAPEQNPDDQGNTGDDANTPGTIPEDGTTGRLPDEPAKTNDNILVYASLGLVSALTVGFSAKRKENN